MKLSWALFIFGVGWLIGALVGGIFTGLSNVDVMIMMVVYVFIGGAYITNWMGR